MLVLVTIICAYKAAAREAVLTQKLTTELDEKSNERLTEQRAVVSTPSKKLTTELANKTDMRRSQQLVLVSTPKCGCHLYKTNKAQFRVSMAHAQDEQDSETVQYFTEVVENTVNQRIDALLNISELSYLPRKCWFLFRGDILYTRMI